MRSISHVFSLTMVLPFSVNLTFFRVYKDSSRLTEMEIYSGVGCFFWECEKLLVCHTQFHINEVWIVKGSPYTKVHFGIFAVAVTSHAFVALDNKCHWQIGSSMGCLLACDQVPVDIWKLAVGLLGKSNPVWNTQNYQSSIWVSCPLLVS